MRGLFLLAGLMALLGAGCRNAVEDPMVWVTPDTRTYHTSRCVGVPAGCRMKRLSAAQAEDLQLCEVCSAVVLPGPLPDAGETSPPPAVPQPQVFPPERSSSATPVSLEDTEVYLTASGGKYHRVNCVHLGSKQAVRLVDAVRAGHTACAVCGPPRLPNIAPVPASPVPVPARPGPQLVVP